MDTMFDFLKNIKVYKNEKDETQSRFITDECQRLITVKHEGVVIAVIQTDPILCCKLTPLAKWTGYVVSISD